MEVLENNSESNVDIVTMKVAEAVERATAELIQLDSAGSDIDSMLMIYVDLVKLLNSFKLVPLIEVDYLSPLNKLMLKTEMSLDQRAKLLCVASIALFLGLANPSTFKGTCEYLCSDNGISNLLCHFEVEEENAWLNLGVVDGVIELIRKNEIAVAVPPCAALLKILSDIDGLLSLLTRFSNPETVESDNTFTSLEKIVNSLLNDASSEVTTIVMLSHNSFNAIKNLKSNSEAIMTYCKLINYMVVETSVFNLPLPFVKERMSSVFFNCSMKLPTFSVSNSNVVRGMKFVLACLNHKDTLDHDHILNLVYIRWSLDQIRSYSQLVKGKVNIYSMYNALYPKYSLFSTIEILMERLIQEYFKAKGIGWPRFLSKCSTKLPPLPKETYLLDTFENPSPSDMSLVDDNYGKLIVIDIIKGLDILSIFAADELKALSSSNGALNTVILAQKFSGMFDVLLLCANVVYDNPDALIRTTAFHVIVKTFVSVLGREDIQGEIPFGTWLEFVQQSTKFAMSDLNFVPIIHQILEDILIELKGTPALSDPTVRNEIISFLYKMPPAGSKYVEIKRYSGIATDDTTIRFHKDDFGAVYDLIDADEEEEEAQIDNVSVGETMAREISNLSIEAKKPPDGNSPTTNRSGFSYGNLQAQQQAYFFQQNSRNKAVSNGPPVKSGPNSSFVSPQFQSTPMHTPPQEYTHMLAQQVNSNYSEFLNASASTNSSNVSGMPSRYGATYNKHPGFTFDKYSK